MAISIVIGTLSKAWFGTIHNISQNESQTNIYYIFTNYLID